MNKVIIYLSLVFLLISCGNIPGREIKVKNASELVNAIKDAQAGDEIIMANGVWKDLHVHFTGKGTKDNPIILRAETAGEVSVEGQSYFKLAGEYLIISGLQFKNGYSPSNAIIEFRINKNSIANNCTVTDCVINEFTKPNRSMQDHWIVFWGRHNRLAHCSVSGKFNQGPTVKVFLAGNQHTNNYHEIVNNYFGPRPRKGGPKAETIQIGASTTSMTPSHTIISNNYFDRCNGEVEVISNKSNNCEVKNNVFFECEGSVVLRHGNYCIVDGNFFIGNDRSPFYGGIRVINTGHWITNNYFYKISGDEFRAPLAIMNGIPKSPLNRYNQVTDAVVAFNTWVDCPAPWQISVGANIEKANVLPASEIRSARPLRVEIANNIVYNHQNSNELIKSYDRIDGINFKNNIAVNFNSEAIMESGIVPWNLTFEKKDEWIFTPSSDDVHKLADVFNGFGYNDIRTDIFGVKRAENNLIGSMLLPLAKNFSIIDKSRFGPGWFEGNKIASEPGKISITNTDEFVSGLAGASDGDTLELVGEFTISSSLTIDKKIIIRSENNETMARIIYKGEEDTPLFEMNSKGYLILESIVIKGMGTQQAFASLDSNMSNVYNIDINGSEISDFKTVLFAYKDSMADTLSFVASKFNNCRSGIILAAETDAKGDYNAEVVTIDNCSFNNIEGGVIDFYRGGYDESTIGGCLTIMNSRFTSCGGQGQDNTLFKTTGIVNVAIENNVFKSNPVKYIAILWGEKNNKHSNNEIINSGKILVEEFLKQKLVY